ncbi:MAG: DNA polymerase [Candidatus Paceibacterota bacterium]|jgi:DNA polymerase-1
MKKEINNREKLVLLDAHAIIHRAYHALPDFATSGGEPTGALYGLVTMILKIATDLKPDYIVACYDLPKPTYRHEVYEGYKAGRKKTDDELSLQLEKSKQICEVLNIPIYSLEGFEADDMLGTIVEKFKIENLKLKIPIDIVIASGDMDTMQLVSDGGKNNGSVKVYTLKKGIKETILYDEKAVLERFDFEPKFLVDFKGLRGDPSDNIIGVAGIGEKSATDLIKNFGTIEELYKQIRNPKSEIRKKIKPRILELLEKNEEEAKFSKMLATIRRDAPIDFVLPSQKWREGLDLKVAENLFAKLEFRNMGARLKSVLEGGKETIKEEKIENKQKIDDKDLQETLIALWVADSNITNPKPEDLFNFAGTEDFDEAKKIVFAELKKRESQSIFEDIEKPLIPILMETQKYGISVDKKFLENLGDDYSKILKDLEKNIWQEAGVEFNVASPKQLGEVLFDKLGLSVKNQKKTAGGAKSTKESELQKMKDLHPIIPLILEYRELSKIISTYIEPIPKALDENSRLHARFVQTGAATGRMSSESPNLQNIPIGSERGKVIRKAFFAPRGSQLFALDYSQIELRIAAFLAQDKKMIEIFKNGQDIHTAVAMEVFKVSEEEVTKEMRRQAKIINFGILYGMGVTALQANIGTDRQIAQKFINAYFENFAGLAKYLDNAKIEATKNGYTKTFFGRRRYFEGLKSRLPFIKAAAERMAINAPIQGTSADIIKIAMKKIDDFIKTNNLADSVHLLMQIHDELIYEVKDEVLASFGLEAKKIMENVMTLEQSSGVPLVVNTSSGQNWGELK